MDDHQSIVDGYTYRLKNGPRVEVVGAAAYGEELGPLLAAHPADVVILDVTVPTAPDNPNPYPILHLIPQFIQTYPDMAVLVISMHLERILIQAVMDAGASGYILKDDQSAIEKLGAIVESVAGGGIFLSEQAHQCLFKHQRSGSEVALTPRQGEALSLCAAYPNSSTRELSDKLGVSHSTVRNLLSGAYLRLGVNTRAAAIATARHLGLITPLVGPSAP